MKKDNLSCNHENAKIDNFCKDNLLDENSLIAKVFDQFNLKDTIIKLSKKSPFQVTSEFIDATILFIFLSLVFSEAEVLKFEYSIPMVALAVIGFSAIIEGFYVNTSVLKRYIGREANVKRFLEKMPSLSPRECRDEIRNLFFSSKCINYFLCSMLTEKNEYPPYVIESIIRTQILSRENFDLLFSPPILKKILPNVIIEMLPKYRDCLTYEHVLNLYNHFKDDDAILKILIATQSNSYLLKDNFLNNSKLDKYYTDYQVNKKHIDWKLKIIPLKIFKPIENVSFALFTLFFLLSYFYGKTIPIQVEPTELIGIIISSMFLGALFGYILIGGVFKRIINYYYNHLTYNILGVVAN